MSIFTSVLEELLRALPNLRSQIYFKASLTALSHAMEDQVLAGSDPPLVIASFQREHFYRQEAHRYLRIAERTQQVYVLAAPETDFKNQSSHYETVAFEPDDALSQEWHLIVIGQQYASCLICQERERPTLEVGASEPPGMDQARRFEGIWTFDRQVSCQAAELLLQRIAIYRPELADKVDQARKTYSITAPAQYAGDGSSGFHHIDPGPFAERLVTYLQAGQYKLLKTYRSIAIQERKERLVNSITTAIRRSLNSDEIFKIAVEELGQALEVGRCLIYRCKETDTTATIQSEFLGPMQAENQGTKAAATRVKSLAGQIWPLQENPLFQEVVHRRERVYVENAQKDSRIVAPGGKASPMGELANRWQIGAWLLVPVLYQDRLLGMVELHHCPSAPHVWREDELSLVEAIATQVGVALIQAEAYANLEDLNQQLEALERTRSNLIAITGHELRTPLSTIQVCLESLASDPDMPLEVQQVMLSSALADAERMRKLVQDFITLSRLESGRVEWHLEPLPIGECVELALSSIRSKQSEPELPQVSAQIPANLPLVRADGEWLVEVISKLLDNACKFTPSTGKVTVKAQRDNQMLKVTVADTGRGIEPNRLEAVFDRFYQEEGALRRTTGGTGLGLAICRQIVMGLGGEIWAESVGKDQGSQFHFTIPIAEGIEAPPQADPQQPSRTRGKARSRRSQTTLR